MSQDMNTDVMMQEYPILTRHVNQPGKRLSFHTDRFMGGYNDGLDACSDGVGDDNNAEYNSMDGNLRVIAILDMSTYGNQCCENRSVDIY